METIDAKKQQLEDLKREREAVRESTARAEELLKQVLAKKSAVTGKPEENVADASGVPEKKSILNRLGESIDARIAEVDKEKAKAKKQKSKKKDKPAPVDTVASVPVMITRKMERDLKNLGWTQTDINKFTPAEAWEIIKENVPPLGSNVKEKIAQLQDQIKTLGIAVEKDLQERHFLNAKADLETAQEAWRELRDINDPQNNRVIELHGYLSGLGTRIEAEIEKWAPEPQTPKEAEAVKEIKNMPEEERAKIGWGLATLGLKFERAKNDFFIKSLNFKEFDSQSTMGRFLGELKGTFVRDNKEVEKKTKEFQNEEASHFLSRYGLLVGNVLKYGRIATDLVGKTAASPFRYVMMAGMATARMSEAGKEARLKNEEVIEKTRVQDADAAAEIAWKIYAEAEKKAGKGKISTATLKDAYLRELPDDLRKRLENPGVANSLIQEIIKKDLEIGLKIAVGNIQAIEANDNLSPEEKKQTIDRIFEKQRKTLEDYDRMVTQYGTVDGLAMSAKYAQTAGKAIVAGLQLETLALSLEKVATSVAEIWQNHHLSSLISSAEKSAIKSSAIKHVIKSKLEKAGSGVHSPKPANVNISAKTEEVAKKAAETVAKISPERHEVTTEFSLKLGENGIPKNLETVFNEIASDHMNIPDGSPVSEEFATKSLNMAANMVKLADGHGVPGVSADDFAKAAEFKNGALTIKDHGLFNGLVEKLQSHSEELWQKGVLQGKGAAITQINKISTPSWLKIVHADGIHEGLDAKGTSINTGILGHQKITLEQIKNFSESDLVKKATQAVIETKSHLAETVTSPAESATASAEASPTPVNTQAQIEAIREHIHRTIAEAETLQTAPKPHGMIIGEKYQTGTTYGTQNPYARGVGVGAGAGSYYGETFPNYFYPDLSPQENSHWNELIRIYPEFRANPFHLPGRALLEVYEFSKKHLSHLFPENPDLGWNSVKNDFSFKMLNDNKGIPESQLPPFVQYLQKLQRISGLKPGHKLLGFGHNETNREYVARALEKIKSLNRLGDVI